MNHHSFAPNSATFRVFFGHQSIGQNILEGITELESADSPTILAADDELPSADGATLVLQHARIGRNGDPFSKIEDFSERCRHYGERYDMMLFKFCYVDVTARTCIEKLFEAYSEAISQLAASLPQTLFAHVTVPLKAFGSAHGSRLRTLLRIQDSEHRNNETREYFNSMLRARYGTDSSLFDLAAIESDRHTTSAQGHQDAVPSLLAQYTNDGGHLNARGRRIAAQEFLRFIEPARSMRCLQQ